MRFVRGDILGFAAAVGAIRDREKKITTGSMEHPNEVASRAARLFPDARQRVG
jgi:hypothetical protein